MYPCTKFQLIGKLQISNFSQVEEIQIMGPNLLKKHKCKNFGKINIKFEMRI